VLALLVVAGPSVAPLRRARPIVADAERPGSDWHLAYLRRSLDHAALYHDFSGAGQAMKEADLLILGDSSALFAFAHEPLEEFSRRTGLRCYVMALAYAEREDFAAALIRKYDLRPKWLIVNANPFFLHRESSMALQTRQSGAFDAWKVRLETVASYEVRHRLHQLVPHFEIHPPRADWVIFRNDRDGSAIVAASSGIARPARIVGKGTFARAKESWITGARAFEEWTRARGAQLVLTTIPPRSPNIGIDIAEALRVPVVLPGVPTGELVTIDGVHLDGPSARRYSEAFLEELEKVVRGEALPAPERVESVPVAGRKRARRQ